MRKGFTLLETVFAVAIFGLVVGLTMGSWLLFMYKSNRVNTQASLDMDVRRLIERFRYDVRETARETIVFYPEKQEPYQAVSFAAPGSGTNGMVEMTADGSNILWRQTVVYHVYDRSPHQMRRTVFSNRNNSASYADRYDQISKVVATGSGESACLSGESAVTQVMFENLFTGRLWHAEAEFDGYAAVPNTIEKVTCGSLSLGPGSHTVTFTSEGKNASSSGYALRLDRLSASVSGWPMEAEYRATSGSACAPYFVGQGLAGAAYGLLAGTSAQDDSVSVTMLNDAIEESVFVGENRNVSFSNTVVRFDATNPPTGFESGVYVAKLDGQFGTEKNWAAGDQTSSTRDDYCFSDGKYIQYYYPTNCTVRIPIMADPNLNANGEPVLYGLKKTGYGPVFRLYKSSGNGELVLSNPSFVVLDSSDVPDKNSNLQPKISVASLIPLRFWQNGVQMSDWSSCTKMSYLELRPATAVQVPLGSTLILQFQVTVTAYGADRFTRFPMNRYDSSGRLPGCWVVRGGGSSLLSVDNWNSDPRLVTEYVLPTVEGMTVGYADGGDYISHPYDTSSSAGKAKTISWDADVPSGASLTLYARTGDTLTDDGFGISDASDWQNVASAINGSQISSGTGRYVQFRALFAAQPASQYPGLGGVGSAGPYRSATPRLRRVLLSWDGEEKDVDIAATLLKGPDCGRFSVKVDDKPLVRGVTMEIEIFKDVTTQGGVQKERLRSAMTAEVEPRNSGK